MYSPSSALQPRIVQFNDPSSTTGSRPETAGCQQKGGPPNSDLFSCFSNFQFDSKAGTDNPSWLSDIELTHHYTANAHRTLYSPCFHSHNALQNDVPREGLSHPFLLRQVLAFSALHLAYLRPDSRHQYLIQASQHQGVAISTMNSILAKPIMSSVFHALYTSSIFVAISAFATFPCCDRYNEAFRPVDSLVDIFVLIRGMHLLLRSSDESLRQGPLKDLMIGCSCEPLELDGYLEPLTSRLGELLSYLEHQTPMIEEDKRQTLIDTVVAFIGAIGKVFSNRRITPTPELRVVFGWPMRLTSSYHALLRNGDPLALVVLSHYCVLLQSREPKYWFFQGWTSALMEPIMKNVVGTIWEELIQWPLAAIEKDRAAAVKIPEIINS
ncbi:hypothetical protein FDECE_4199 [Fusarium decemcellulare]|nr:hypothetical protein FDECE_4199 [Fusarium decemcellulare]